MQIIVNYDVGPILGQKIRPNTFNLKKKESRMSILLFAPPPSFAPFEKFKNTYLQHHF
jgi:hypothetical protein